MSAHGLQFVCCAASLGDQPRPNAWRCTIPELASAWITLAISTRNAERDIRRGLERAERGAKINPQIDIGRFGAQADRAGRDFNQRFERSAGRGGFGGGAAGKAFVGAFGAMLAAGGIAQLASAAAREAVDAVKEVFDTGLDFSRAVNNFQGVTRATALEMAKMQEAARALGTDTNLAGASASDAATAMTELAKAGFSVDEAVGAARGTLQLATAAQVDAAEAAEIQSNAMNAFGLNASNAARVADLFATAAAASSADIPDLGLALQQVGGIAHGFGVNIEDTIAALAMFSQAGIKGSDAGTLLKTTLQSITDQGNPAQGAIESLGLSLYDFDKHQFVGFRELFRQLDEAKKRMTPEQFQAETNILFGSDAMRSAVLGNAQAFDEMRQSLNRAGAASEMAGAQMQGWPGIVEATSNTMEGLKLSVFDVFNTAAGQELGNTFVSGLEGISGWVSSHKPEIIGFFTEFATGTLTAADAFGQLASSTMRMGADILEAMNEIGVGVGGFFELLARGGSVLKHLPGEAGRFGESLEKLSNMGSTFMEGQPERVREMANAVDKGREKLPELIENIGDLGARAKESEEFMRNLGTSVALLDDKKTVVITDNSPEAIARIDKTKWAIEQIPGTQDFMLVPKTEQAKTEIDGFVRSVNGKTATLNLDADTAAADQKIATWIRDQAGKSVTLLAQVQGLPGAPAVPGPPTNAPGQGLPGMMLPKKAGGGSILGPGGPTSDIIPIWASNGEHMLPADEVGMLGGQSGVYAFRKLLRTGAFGKYADGGAIGAGVSQVASLAGQYGLELTSGRAGREGETKSYHSSGNAGDFSNGVRTDQMLAFATAMAQNYGSNLSELIYDDPRFNMEIKDGRIVPRSFYASAGDHTNHVHVALKGSLPALGNDSFDTLATAGGGGTAAVQRARAAVTSAQGSVTSAQASLDQAEAALAEAQAKGQSAEKLAVLEKRRDAAQQKLTAAQERQTAAETKLSEVTEKAAGSLEDGGSSGGMDASSFGQSLVSGMFEALSLPGFSDFMDWPNVKSGLALANWGGNMLKGYLSQEPGGGPVDLSGGGGAFPDLAGFTNALRPREDVRVPIDPATTQHGKGGGQAPGPRSLIEYSGTVNLGVDPSRWKARQDTDMRQAFTAKMSSVRPGQR